MDSTRTRNSLIDSAIDNCLAFSQYIESLKARQFVSKFPLKLLAFVNELNQFLVARLKELSSDEDFQSLEDEVAELQILRYSQLHSYLHLTASFVERADTSHTLAELVQPLRRLMRQGLPDIQFILHPLPVLNYSFYPLGYVLSNMMEALGFTDLLGKSPSKQLATIGFPGLQTKQFLMHSMVAHELGHCLYLEHNLEAKLLPNVRPDEQTLEDIAKNLAKASLSSGLEPKEKLPGQRTLSDLLSEIEIRSYITREMTNITRFWVKELTCDAIAYRLFGPAYVFAALSFLTSGRLFDADEATHPPNRMRFLLLYDMLDSEQGFLDIVDPKVSDLLERWRNTTRSHNPQFSDPIRALAGSAIMGISSTIIQVATSAADRIGRYSATAQAEEIQALLERIKMLVPPNEIIQNGTARQVRLQSVVNAGWLAYIGELEPLGKKYNWEPWECKAKINELIAKAIEFNEVQSR